MMNMSRCLEHYILVSKYFMKITWDRQALNFHKLLVLVPPMYACTACDGLLAPAERHSRRPIVITIIGLWMVFSKGRELFSSNRQNLVEATKLTQWLTATYYPMLWTCAIFSWRWVSRSPFLLLWFLPFRQSGQLRKIFPLMMSKIAQWSGSI